MHVLHPLYEAEDVRRHSTIKITFYILKLVFIFGLQFYYLERTLGIRDSIAGVVTRLQYERFGVRIPAGEGIFLFSTMARRSTGRTQPPIQWVREALSPGVDRPGSEADYSPVSDVEVKNGGTPTLPLHAFVVGVGKTLPNFFLLEFCCAVPE